MIGRATLLIFCFLTSVLSAQESGLPLSRHFTADQYQAHNQNWAISQDSSGVMFFGNNNGILRFDGSEWQLFPTPKGGIIRSLSQGYARKMYAGAYAEFGYLTGDEFGRLRWISLSDSLPKSLREFSDVWKIHVTPRGIFITSPQYIFLFSHDDRFIASWKPAQRFRFSYWLRDRFVVQDEQTGLCEVIGDSLVFVAGSFPLADTRIYAILPHGDSAILIQTRSNGTWLWEKDQFKKIPWEAGRYLEEQQVYGGIMTSWGQYIFTTLRNGLVLTGQDGRILQIYNKQSGLPDNLVYDVFTDRTEGIWIAMNRGIMRADLFAPFTYWNESMGLEGATFCVARHATKLYAGTSNGVFYLEKNSLEKPWVFKKLNEPQGQCWSLLVHDGNLLAAMSTGIYQISGTRVQRLSDSYGFVLSPSLLDPAMIHVGLSSGLGRLRRTPDGYAFDRIDQAFREEIRYIAEDREGSVWMAGGFDGFQRLLSDGTVREYHPNSQTRARRNRLFATTKGILFVTDRGLMRFSPSSDKFDNDTLVAPLISESGKHILRLSEDSSGHLWIVQTGATSTNNVGKIHFRQNAGYTRYLPLKRISQYGEVSTIWNEGRSIWFGGYDGLLQYKSSSSLANIDPGLVAAYPPVILTVRMKNDSLVYVGQGTSERAVQIDYSMNEVRFAFADPGNLSLTKREYRFRLHGFDADWIQGEEFKKTYTFLPEGNYSFEVTSTEAHYTGRPTTFSFVIHPPLYRTWWAYTLYVLLFLTFGVSVVQIRNKHVENDRRRLRELVEQQTTELRIANTEMQNSHVRLERTINIVEAINSQLDLDKLLKSIFETVQPLLHMKSGSVLLRDTVSGHFKFHAAFGVDPSVLKNIELTEEEAVHRYVEKSEMVAEGMYFIRNLIARRGTDKFRDLPLIDSLFVIQLTDDKGLAGFLLFDNIAHASPNDLLMLTALKEHIRTALTKLRMLTELRTLNEKKNEYLGIVAHDLRNPLTTIMGYADLITEDIRKGKFNPDSAIEDLSKISGVSKHMNRFISELLDISAIESGKVRMELRNSDIKMVVGNCEHLHQRSSQNKRIDLSVDYSAPLPPVHVDEEKISSVVDNLLSNAIKYTHPGGRVKVYFEHRDSEVVTHVEDTGQGLSGDDLEKVFTSFRRLSSKPTGGEPSTGLGLAIVKKIVELHHGRVWVKSQRGEGSTFSFSLPVVHQK